MSPLAGSVHWAAPLHVQLLVVHPLELFDEQVSVHGTVWPQLLVAFPQARPLHAAVLSGVQHVLFPRQTCAPVHELQVMVCWQLFVTVVLHLPAHGVTLSGRQHVFPRHTSFDDEQLGVPPDPHATT